MKVIIKLISALIVPFAILNLLGGVVSGIWLAVLGEWWAVVVGILGMFVTHSLLGLAFMPGVLFALPGMHFMERGNRPVAYVALLLSQLYMALVITVWCTLVMAFFLSRATPDTIVPLLIWSYGFATGPLVYLARQDEKSGGGTGSVTATFFAELAFVVAGIAVLFFPVTLLGVGKVIGTVMLLFALVQFVVTVSAANQIEAEASY